MRGEHTFTARNMKPHPNDCHEHAGYPIALPMRRADRPGGEFLE
jgi:hypothetical protein